MKKFIAFMAILALLVSCGKSGDKSWSVQGGKWHPEKPYGMTLVPGGAFIMGKSDDDVSIQDAPTKTVTVRSFYMDETESTNSEYRNL
jgi:formylglycine-generating enzyme required for sulfatase activity